MPLLEALEHVYKATNAHLHYEDECGHDVEDLIVALSVFGDHMEELTCQGEFSDGVMKLLKKKWGSNALRQSKTKS